MLVQYLEDRVSSRILVEEGQADHLQRHQLDLADTAVIDAPSLYQILIFAIIETDESKERSLNGDGKNDFRCASDDSHSIDQISKNDIGSVELQRLDLCPEMHAEEEGAIIKDIIELEGGLVQQIKKQLRLHEAGTCSHIWWMVVVSHICNNQDTNALAHTSLKLTNSNDFRGHSGQRFSIRTLTVMEAYALTLTTG